MKRVAALCALFLLFAPAAPAQIRNIRKFLDQCPNNDPAFARIRADFEIRRNGVPIATPACTEPVSLMPTAAYTDELIVLQGLRSMYYMDRGQNSHLPWTTGTLYDWMRSKIGGINISGTGSFCCLSYGGKTFINVGGEDDFNREFDKKWIGISDNIALYTHETRHVDGFPHDSCCGIPNGCDVVFGAGTLSPYGTQWWLYLKWLDGTINVGLECSPADVNEARDWFLSGLNGQFASRFCTNKPDPVVAPALVGGPCLAPVRHRAARHR